MTDFDDLLAKAEKATPGPWHKPDCAADCGQVWTDDWPVAFCDTADDNEGPAPAVYRANAAYIAAASPDVIRDLVLRLREVEEQYGERCAEYQRLDRNFDLLQERLREAEEALRPFQRVGWPSVSDPDDNEGDIPDFTEVDVVASGFDLNATDYMVDPLTVGDFRRAAAYFDTTEGGE